MWTDYIDKVKKEPIIQGGLNGFRYSVDIKVKDLEGINKKVKAIWFSMIDKDEVIDNTETDPLKRYDWDWLRCTIEQFDKGKFIWSENGQNLKIGGIYGR